MGRHATRRGAAPCCQTKTGANRGGPAPGPGKLPRPSTHGGDTLVHRARAHGATGAAGRARLQRLPP
eukprot:8940662-Lingulodinium_polyedra.AAC.1